MKIIKENKNITVSVCVITYNQEQIIGQVLDYIVNQKTNFNFEIVLGEDCSKDQTTKICIEYKNKYPDIINLLLNERNLGLIDNFSNVISQCGGKYIAVCAGDDFWIDPLKLQKQVDFLENNPDFSMCSCETYYNSVNFKNNFKSFLGILYNNYKLSGKMSFLNLSFEFIFNRKSFWQKRRLTPKLRRPSIGTLKTVLDDLDKARYYAASANLFKREVVEQIPYKAFDYKAEHILIIIWAALNGKIKIIDDVMVIKNTLETSVTISKVLQDKYIPKQKYDNHLCVLNLIKEQNISTENLIFINKKIDGLKSLNH